MELLPYCWRRYFARCILHVKDKMMTNEAMLAARASWRDYLELCKPRVVLLMLLTVVVGMCLATPGWLNGWLTMYTLLGVAFCSGSAAAINHLLDRHIDSIMLRTQKRPVAHGRLSIKQALCFALVMGLAGLFILLTFVNQLTALLTFISLIGYAGVYTGYLKRATSQNIVIGGLAGAAPPLLGWTAVTNHLDPNALLLVLIIFTWTPPHFWALAIYRFEEYQHAEIPMLPVTYGIEFTKLNIYLYTILLLVVSVLPFITGMSGWLYLVGAIGLGLRFLWWAHRLYHNNEPVIAMQTFRISIVYLMVLFVFLLIDHYW
jgi:protoheme IX farnesyltransferase